MKNTIRPTKETLDLWHGDPSNWKWGMFYYNKDDKRLFPPKKIKQFGWTINFANPKSILLFIAVMAITMVALIIISRAK